MTQTQYPSNEEMVSFRKKHLLPTAVHYHKTPLQPVRAQGEYVWDSEGKKYLDSIGGIVCISAGHNHPKIKKALMKMLEDDELQHTSTLYLSRHLNHLVKTLNDHAPQKIDTWHITNSGSEANEAAIMAARNATGESMVVNLRHSYHGGTSGTLASCGHSSWRFKAQPVTNVTSAMEPYCYRCPFGQKRESCDLECAKNVETTIQSTTSGKIAAFIAEPVMGVGGFIDPPNEYFHEVAGIVHKYGGKYISDEVQTGVGRCGGAMFLTKEIGFDADMVSMAKGLGNGAPVGAVGMKRDIADSLAGKAFFNTFGGDPFQSVQAAMTLEIINDEGMIKNAREMGALLKDGLKELMKSHPLIGDVRGRGLLLGIELVKDRTSKTHAIPEAAELMDLCSDRGLLLGKGGLLGNVIRIAPPLSLKRDQVAFILKVLDESLSILEKK
jgi:4-aminobutyrate aminotransferase-like enzyme